MLRFVSFSVVLLIHQIITLRGEGMPTQDASKPVTVLIYNFLSFASFGITYVWQ